MQTQTIDTKQIKQNISLIDLAGRYSELRKESPSEYSGPCPKCGGTDRFHCKGDMFFCRQCYPLDNNQPHDAIAFLQWVEGKTFKDACNALTGNYQATVTQARPAAKEAKQREWNEANQQQQAMRAHNALIAQKADEARAALVYLQGRGIDLDTVKAFKIGVRMTSLPGAWDSKTNLFAYPRQIAISLPWFDQSGALVAVKYRFLTDHTYTDVDGRQRTHNKNSKGNFAGHVFGWQAIKGPGKVDAIVNAEGELNALSLWQEGKGRFDVLSTGTESMIEHLPHWLVDWERQYAHRIVWADRGTLADSAALAIDAASMRSPMIDGYSKGADANDLLKMGKLGALLDAMLQRLAPIAHAAPQAITGDLCGYVGATVDAGTWQALQAECTQRYGDLWHFDAADTGDGWHIKQLHAHAAPQTPTAEPPIAEPPTESIEDWTRRRDERWLQRWQAGLTEDTPFTRANVEAAAQRLGLRLYGNG